MGGVSLGIGGHDGWEGHWGKGGTDLLRGGLSSVLLSHWELSVDACELLSHMGLCTSMLGVSTRPHCLNVCVCLVLQGTVLGIREQR